jgi:hypothetical protein
VGTRGGICPHGGRWAPQWQLGPQRSGYGSKNPKIKNTKSENALVANGRQEKPISGPPTISPPFFAPLHH